MGEEVTRRVAELVQHPLSNNCYDVVPFVE